MKLENFLTVTGLAKVQATECPTQKKCDISHGPIQTAHHYQEQPMAIYPTSKSPNRKMLRCSDDIRSETAEAWHHK